MQNKIVLSVSGLILIRFLIFGGWTEVALLIGFLGLALVREVLNRKLEVTDVKVEIENLKKELTATQTKVASLTLDKSFKRT